MDPTRHATLRIAGAVGDPAFPPWIRMQATRRGLTGVAVEAANDGLTVRAAGAAAMLESLALVCALGPREVAVDDVDLQFDRVGASGADGAEMPED
ncbi:acylphosphatase [Jannaschia sp. LMIT008]|uniref:acylphosphatase n=1 Tax=Jannaschia maritima TaxID=3032585 RepID=UPI002810F78B|nr:acylphosphatase [Jannaschia sp. LMIT008]